MTTAPGFVPSWPAPATVGSYITCRHGGASQGPYRSNNLASHVGDTSDAVAHNRRRLRQHLAINEPCWLNQVHGADWVDAGHCTANPPPDADASITDQPGRVCAILTADCLPLLLCDRFGHQIAAVHGGWRSLAQGIIPRILEAFKAAPEDLLAYLGPAISHPHYEVGAEVRDALSATITQANDSFSYPSPDKPNHYQVNLYALARTQLSEHGITQIYGGDRCTFTESDHFYSYRRDGTTGRQASLIWLRGPQKPQS